MVKSIDYFFHESKHSSKSINYYDYKEGISKQDFLVNESIILSQEYVQINEYKDSLIGYSASGSLVSIGVIQYNQERQVIKSQAFDIKGGLYYTEISNYDNTGRLIEMVIENTDSISINEIYKYTYDSIGRLQTFSVGSSTDTSESVERYSYETDEMGNWIKKQIWSDEGELMFNVTRNIEYK